MIERLDERFQKRFWVKVDKSGGKGACWIWVACRQKSGHGLIGISAGTAGISAHKASWILANGRDVPKGYQVCHNCPGGDNPRCVNPDHLLLMTPREHTLDKIAKGQSDLSWIRRPGTLNGRSKFTAKQVTYIRRQYARGGISMEKLAECHGVAYNCMWKILTNKSYRDLSPSW